MTRKTIRTPKGKWMTEPQYLALQDAISTRTMGGGPACDSGHFDCAVWEGGPCAAELRACSVGIDSESLRANMAVSARRAVDPSYEEYR